MQLATCWRCKCAVDIGDYWFWTWVCPQRGCRATNVIKERSGDDGAAGGRQREEG